MDLLNAVVLGSYAFGAGAFAWAWALYRTLSARLDALWVRVTNHQEHEIRDLKRRVSDLESK